MSVSDVEFVDGGEVLADFSKTFGARYQIQQPLGAGAHGRTYVARDTRRRIDVCVKLFREGVATPGSDRDWHITSTLKHPALGDTFTVEEFPSGGRSCTAVISRYIEGHNLEEILARLEAAPPERQRDLSLRLLDSLSGDLCSGVIACHEHGFGHGDLHQRNVVVRQRDALLGAVIIDFDNATIAGSTASEVERRAKDIRSLRRLIGLITHGWKWHDALQRLLDHHATAGELRNALAWGQSFLCSADGFGANKINLNAFCQALYHHNFMTSVAPHYVEEVMRTVEDVATDLRLEDVLAEAKQSWRQRTKNQFSWHLPPAPPGYVPDLDPVLAELWPPSVDVRT